MYNSRWKYQIFEIYKMASKMVCASPSQLPSSALFWMQSESEVESSFRRSISYLLYVGSVGISESVFGVAALDDAWLG